MDKTRFIQVILPLKLDWEPYYYLEGDAPVQVGARVFVQFARRPYVGVVSAVGVTPGEGMNILPAGRSSLPPVLPEEIALWRSVADYYLCTAGEVYKAAYPAVKTENEVTGARLHERLEKRLQTLLEKAEKARKDTTRERYKADAARLQAILEGKRPPFVEGELSPLSPAENQALSQVRQSFSAGKTVLLRTSPDTDRITLFLNLARETLAAGRNVLYLVPEIALTRQLEQQVADIFPDLQVYHSAKTAAARRSVADTLRSGSPYVVLGTRSALFLPHRNLGLVIVDAEQDSSYKQDSPAPRYHARETAILLALVHSSHVLISSITPSLESMYNTETGLFTLVNLQQDFRRETTLVNLSAEYRKRGMSGSYSLKLLEKVKAALDQGGKVLLISRSKAALEENEAEFRNIFPDIPADAVTFVTPAGIKLLSGTDFSLAAVIQADNLLGKEDFRADEKTLQLLQQLPCRSLLIQTREDRHPVFQALLNGSSSLVFLDQRRAFGYPPFSRIIDTVVKDKNEKRLDYLSAALAVQLKNRLTASVTLIGPYEPAYSVPDALPTRLVRLLIPRDKQLRATKKALVNAIAAFEKERKYTGHIHLDVDPA